MEKTAQGGEAAIAQRRANLFRNRNSGGGARDCRRRRQARLAGRARLPRTRNASQAPSLVTRCKEAVQPPPTNAHRQPMSGKRDSGGRTGAKLPKRRPCAPVRLCRREPSRRVRQGRGVVRIGRPCRHRAMFLQSPPRPVPPGGAGRPPLPRVVGQPPRLAIRHSRPWSMTL